MSDNDIFQMWELFKKLLLETKRPGIDNIIKWLDKTDFKFAPASTRFHSSFRGGLLKHSLSVYYHMYDFQPFIQFFEIPEDTIRITALLHDICKVECYGVSEKNVKNEQGEWIKVPYYTWNDMNPEGHAEKSIFILYENGLQITKMERQMILNHMGFCADRKTEQVSALFDRCPQSLVLHWADELSTYVTESPDLPKDFIQKLVGRNLTTDNKIYEEQKSNININGTTYKLAPQEAEVDEVKIITVPYTNNGVTTQVKVYAPHGDGLPF